MRVAILHENFARHLRHQELRVMREIGTAFFVFLNGYLSLVKYCVTTRLIFLPKL